MCNNPNCQNTAIELKTIENCILSVIENHFNYTILPTTFEKENNSNELFYINKEINRLKLQLSNIFDLIEQKIYSKETFLERKQMLEKNIEILTLQKEKFENTTNQISPIDAPISILELYDKLDDIKNKNQLLKNIFSKIYYSKIDNNIDITIYTKLPIK